MIIYVCALYIYTYDYICHGQNMVVVCSTGSSIHNGNQFFLWAFNPSQFLDDHPPSHGRLSWFLSANSHGTNAVVWCWLYHDIPPNPHDKNYRFGEYTKQGPFVSARSGKQTKKHLIQLLNTEQKSSKILKNSIHRKIPLKNPWDFRTFSNHPFPNSPSFLVSSCILPMRSPSHGHPGLTLWKPPQVIHVHGLF